MCDSCGHKHHKQGHEDSYAPNAFLDDFLKIEGFDAKKHYSRSDDFEDCENSRDYLLASLESHIQTCVARFDEKCSKKSAREPEKAGDLDKYKKRLEKAKNQREKHMPEYLKAMADFGYSSRKMKRFIECGNHLEFHFYPKLRRHKLVRGDFCGDPNCRTCNLIRSNKLTKQATDKVLTAFGEYSANTKCVELANKARLPENFISDLENISPLAGRLRKYGGSGSFYDLKIGMQTLTIQHNEWNRLIELFDHLNDSKRKIIKEASKTRKQDRNLMSENGFRNIMGYMGHIEISESRNGWHPHMHLAVVHEKPICEADLRKDWKRFTKDSKEVDYKPIYDASKVSASDDGFSDEFSGKGLERGLEKGIGEAMKYPFKPEKEGSQTGLSPRRQVQASVILKGRNFKQVGGIFHNWDALMEAERQFWAEQEQKLRTLIDARELLEMDEKEAKEQAQLDEALRDYIVYYGVWSGDSYDVRVFHEWSYDKRKEIRQKLDPYERSSSFQSGIDLKLLRKKRKIIYQTSDIEVYDDGSYSYKR